ncbi:hypothetical protein JQ612_31180 [Bradyrhizobium manausense]|uniref:hypothetical protein n=1 Tax=Bradyrhizobium manausense TaxID=989370 RepID=UPI001BAD41E7|nr:hypothetical protein [Bradyrhizobium manausense]MBR0690286.1 hypothetical protein [Bradyrhizobium manausense]MBR0723364.1 hypothetical protein [Bradyrhizobium manausense]MBR0837679.1 hypothetical protein [Bradyrhizobium manausense]
MAKKVVRKTATKAKAARKKKPRPGDASHVEFGAHGLAHILNAVKTAGLTEEFNKHVGKAGTFVRVRRTGLKSIKQFVDSKPQLAELSDRMGRCNCPKDDPDCIYFGPTG